MIKIRAMVSLNSHITYEMVQARRLSCWPHRLQADVRYVYAIPR